MKLGRLRSVIVTGTPLRQVNACCQDGACAQSHVSGGFIGVLKFDTNGCVHWQKDLSVGSQGQHRSASDRKSVVRAATTHSGVTEIVEIPNRGHALTVDNG
jgi:hypothetical protein